MSHAIESGDKTEEVARLWDCSADAVRSAPPPIRAAIVNGFRWARERGIAADTVAPTEADCLTLSAEAVVHMLVPVAKGLSPADRARIAQLDHGDDIEQHLGALNAVLQRPTCLMTREEYWYPSEVIELVGHRASPNVLTGCTAILLLNTVQPGGRDYGLDHRWRWHRQACLGLPEPARGAILAGFRHCYEARHAFDQMLRKPDPPHLIPWSETPS